MILDFWSFTRRRLLVDRVCPVGPKVVVEDRDYRPVCNANDRPIDSASSQENSSDIEGLSFQGIKLSQRGEQYSIKLQMKALYVVRSSGVPRKDVA